MIYIASGVYVDVGDTVWGRLYTGDGNKSKLIHGEIVSVEEYPPYVDIKTKRDKVYRLSANVLYVTKPKATLVEDELGELTVWEG